MMIAEITIAEWAQIIPMIITCGGVVFMIARGIVTKKDCEKCKSGTDADLAAGSKEFKEIRATQADHGEQLAGIGSTVNSMEQNVSLIVEHHITKGGQ